MRPHGHCSLACCKWGPAAAPGPQTVQHHLRWCPSSLGACRWQQQCGSACSTERATDERRARCVYVACLCGAHVVVYFCICLHDTRVCRTGVCAKHKAGRCVMEHDPAKVAVCVQWLHGACDGRGCTLQHARRPELMPTCMYFLKVQSLVQDELYIRRCKQPRPHLVY